MNEPTEQALPPDAIAAFREVCEKFHELSVTDREGSIPVWGGNWAFSKYARGHPIRAYRKFYAQTFRYLASTGEIVPYFPTHLMIGFLQKFSETQLESLKMLSEINVRRRKAIVTDNPLFKITLPAGAAYTLLEVSERLVKGRGSSLDTLRDLLGSAVMQRLMGSFLVGLILGLILLVVQYLFLIAPAIARAQLLDDLLQMALEEKRFANADSRPGSASQL